MFQYNLQFIYQATQFLHVALQAVGKLLLKGVGMRRRKVGNP